MYLNDNIFNTDYDKKPTEHKFKSQMCKNWLRYGDCPYRDICKYAHGTGEIYENHNTYKTTRCKNQLKYGYCKYGNKCQYLHYDDESYTNKLSTPLNTININKTPKIIETYYINLEKELQKICNDHSFNHIKRSKK